MQRFFVILFALCTLHVSASQIVWPLKIEISQSSSFAEFRGMRLHAGIDLRTQRTNGLPVVAIADGFISRASVQFRGYGYALYIDHPDLNVRVVYGHLQDFQGPLKQYIDAKLKKMGSRHGINDFFTADRFPVKKGQVLALSGETGMGPSHLHFEMRNMADEPVAPAVYGYRPVDKIFPVFHHLHVVPMSHACYIDGSFLSARYNLQKKNAGDYVINSVPHISGKFALQAGISDSNGEGNRYGIEMVSLLVDGNKLLERMFHRYNYDDNRQCPWVYDYFKSNQKNTGYVYNLFKLPCETLPCADQYKAWSGVISSPAIADKDAFGSCKIVALDFGGNSINAEAQIKWSPVDFTRTFTAEEIEAFKFTDCAQTGYSLVAVGERRGASKNQQIQTGKISCSDKEGKTELLDCIIAGSRLEIAFPKDKRWQAGAWIGDSRILPETSLILPEGGIVASEAGANAVFAKNSLDLPMFCRLTRTILEPSAGGNSKRGFLKPYSAVWTLTPDDRVFDAEVKISINPQSYSGNLQKLGIYSVEGDGKYSHNGEKVEDGALVFNSRTGGSYVILEDILPPVLNFARKSSDYHMGSIYVFNVADLGKGVDYLSASATINGKTAEVYSDPDKAEIYVARTTGKNQKLELQIKDQAGNLGKINHNF